MNLPTMNKQIIFVDSSVQDYQSLIQNLDATQIVVLDRNLSGIEQITQALANKKNIAAIHIVSHGSDGTIFFGNSPLNQTTLKTHADTIKQWSESLKVNNNSDILLYGCNIAQTERGKAFVKRLSQLTKANIAASTTPTGNDKLGGDWNLEFIVGKIQATLAFSPAVTAAYSGVLGDGPGGVGDTTGTSNLKLWLKANAITTAANGAPIGIWADNSGNSINATQNNAANQPTYITNVLNGQPVVRFDGSNDQLAFNRIIQNDFSIIAVFRTTQSAGSGTPWYLGAGLVDAEVPGVTDDLGLSLIAGQLATGIGNPDRTLNSSSGFNDGNGHIANFQRVVTSGAFSQFVDGTSTGNTIGGTNSLTAPSRIVLGSLQTNINYFQGDIAEVGIYSKSLNGAERTLIDNYLAAKYNIAISNDKYIGDTAANGNYDSNVAGIGQEVSGSNTSGNTKGGLIIDNGTFLKDNGDYLIAGQIETANATNVTTDLPSATASNRLSRVWYLDKTDINNNGGTANLTFDFSDSGLSGTPTGKYHLLYRSATTGNFAYVNNATSTISTTFTITGDQVTFNNVNLGLLNDGYYTLASKVNDVPLLATITNPAAINEDTGLQTITITGISDLETATNALTLTATSTNTALTGTPTITNNNDGTATLQYTPIANANGTANISVTVTDADSGTVTKSFDVTVNPVNDQPSFTATSPASVNEDSGAQTLTTWATFNPGAVNEAGQTATYTVSNISNGALFSAAPTINSATGNLTYTPAANAFGTSTFDVRVQDSGGTPGVDTSTTQTFTITVNPVNDQPSFTATSPSAVNEDSGAQTLTTWATFNPGAANEATQTPTYTVSNISNGALFSAAPTINNATGNLTYTPAANAFGTSTFDVRVQDSGGTPGVDTSTAQTFTITVNGVNEQPSFTATSPASVNEDSGAQTLTGWATFNPGAADEDGQTATYTVRNIATPSLFATLPAVICDKLRKSANCQGGRPKKVK
ncbi:DUF4347 domain-containing protein [Microcoleus sp. Pol17_C1]|uniref:DUF4347 domain-containing protein n=1 Tax=unclassified Microcoleus TaxID=2642155 RepID=UPI002FD3A452